MACFVGPFLVVTGGVLGLYVVVDAGDHLGDFTPASDSLPEALQHLAVVYVLSLPAMAVPLVPIATLIAAGFAVARLSKQNELTALKACGMSVHRAVTGLLVAGVFVALLAVANQEFLVPRAERFLQPRKLKWTGNKDRLERASGHIDEEGIRYFARYNRATKQLQNIFLYRTDTPGDWTSKRAASGEFLDAQGDRHRPYRWLLKNVTIESRRGQAAAVTEEKDQQIWQTRISPEEMGIDQLSPASLPIGKLLNLARKNPEMPRYRVRLYSRMAYPITGIVLLLIGVPVMLGHPALHKSRALAAGACLIVGILFYGVTFIADNLGVHGHLPAPVAAFLPLVLFGALGVYLFDRVRT